MFFKKDLGYIANKNTSKPCLGLEVLGKASKKILICFNLHLRWIKDYL
jgi:hypothetical protein